MKYLLVTGYDCDWTYGEHLIAIEDNDLQKEIDKILNGAEGPTDIIEITKEQYDSYKPRRSHNLIEEAYENGNQTGLLVR